MVRILVVSNMYPSKADPSFGVFVLERVEAFRRLGARVRVAAVTDARKGRFRTAWKYLVLFFRSLTASLWPRPDVIEAHYLVPTAPIAAVVASLIRRPFVLYVHGSDVALSHGLPVTKAIRWAVSRAATLQTNSEWTAGLIETRFGRRASVVPPGVDPEFFHPPPEGARRSGVACAAGLYEHKGIDVLLRALHLLPASTSWNLVVAGDGPEHTRLEAMAKDLGIGDRIAWKGVIDHAAVAEVFRHAAVVAVPSRRDALGMVAIEALACGTPVVITSVGGLAGVPDAECGTVVPSDDPASMSQAIDWWLNNARSERAATARAAEFSLDTVAAAALAELRRVAG
jgi:glycosyltransferase involved in cell wall biosynthesis